MIGAGGKGALRRLNRRRLVARHARQTGAKFHHWIGHDYRGLGLVVPPLRVVPSSEPLGGGDLILRRAGAGFELHFNREVHRGYLVQIYTKSSAFLRWFELAGPDITEITVNATDGEGPSLARYSYCSCSPAVTALPDAHFFQQAGYAATDRTALAAPAWEDRDDTIQWRGRVNNLGLFTTDPAFADHPAVMQRLRMAMKCRDLGIDFRFVRGSEDSHNDAVEAAGLLGGFVPADTWAGRKFAIDIDGFTNAWSNLLQRLKLGCCVLKVASPFGFAQWYYTRLHAWEHYVPVRADLSDLAEQIDWLRGHPAEARAIAAAGQALAREITLESAGAEAARLIAAREAGEDAR